MIKKFATYLALTTLALGSFIANDILAQLPPRVNGPVPYEVIGNMFSQPNIHLQLGRNKLDWYGSGDVNNDEVINQEDANVILGSTNDRADIDGDGTPGTNQDKSKLQEYLTGQISYLPGHWNSLTTEGERVNWLEKILKVQDMSPYFNQGWICGDYITQMQIDFAGIPNPKGLIEHRRNLGLVEPDTTNNARFNIPFYHNSTKTMNGEPHSIGSVLIGENSLNFESHYVMNYYTDSRIFPGAADLDKDSFMKMGTYAYVEIPALPGTNVFTYVPDLINFNLDNGNATMTEHKSYITLDNPNDDVVTLSNLQDIKVNYQLVQDLTLEKTGTPDMKVTNSPLEAILTHEDGAVVPLNTQYPNHHYKFARTFTGTIESGNVVNQDSLSHSITVEDTENPNFTLPEDISIFQEVEVNSENCGEPTNITDNSNLPVETNVEYIKTDENENEIKYNAIWVATDFFGNDTAKTQKVTVLKAGIKMNNLEDLLVNYGVELNPDSLKNSGFNAIPKVDLYNSTASVVLSFTDSVIVPLSEQYPDIHYQFRRTHFGEIEINGNEMRDSTKQIIVVKDIEAPNFILPQDTVITKDAELDPINTGLLTNVTDNSPYEVTISVNYILISENEAEKKYNAIWSATDVLENVKIDTQKVTVDLLTFVAKFENLPTEFKLEQNYPNPFNPSTIVKYGLQEQSNVKIELFNMLGQSVGVLVNENKSAGYYETTWNAENLPSGIYLISIRAEGISSKKSFTQVKKALLLK